MRAFDDAFRGKGDIGLLILRLALGFVFIGYGVSKLGNLGMVQGMLGGAGIPAPGAFAPLVAIIEVLGGLALILGAGTRIASILLAIIMVVAVLTVTAARGLMGGYDLNVALLGGLMVLLFAGAGAYSVDERVIARPRSTSFAS